MSHKHIKEHCGVYWIRIIKQKGLAGLRCQPQSGNVSAGPPEQRRPTWARLLVFARLRPEFSSQSFLPIVRGLVCAGGGFWEMVHPALTGHNIRNSTELYS